MSNDEFDGFLDDATHEVAAEWERAGGRRLDTEELYALNDLLTGFFSDRRKEAARS